MSVMGMMEVTIDQVVNMIAMGHGLMAALRPMQMPLLMPGALMLRRAIFRIGRCYAYDMLINMAVMRVVQMAIV